MAHILIIATSHSQLGATGRKTGLWLDEFAGPYYVFLDAGHEITVASPRGGEIPIDPASIGPSSRAPAVQRLLEDKPHANVLYTALPLSRIRAAEYDAVFYPGGHGVMWDLASSRENAMIALSFYDSHKPIAAVCHGPAALTLSRTAEGRSILAGHRITGFSNTEEEAVGLTDTVPFLLQERLVTLGTHYSREPDFTPYTITDAPFVTGQNPQSSLDTARQLLLAISRVEQFEHDLIHSQLRAASGGGAI